MPCLPTWRAEGELTHTESKPENGGHITLIYAKARKVILWPNPRARRGNSRNSPHRSRVLHVFCGLHYDGWGFCMAQIWVASSWRRERVRTLDTLSRLLMTDCDFFRVLKVSFAPFIGHIKTIPQLCPHRTWTA